MRLSLFCPTNDVVKTLLWSYPRWSQVWPLQLWEGALCIFSLLDNQERIRHSPRDLPPPLPESFHGLDMIETETWQRCYAKGTMLKKKKKRAKALSLDKNSQLSIHKTKIYFLKAYVYQLKRIFHIFDVIIKKRASYLWSGHEKYIFFRNKTFALITENSTEIIAYVTLSFLRFLFFYSIVTYFKNIKNELNTAVVNGQYTRTHFLNV